MSAEKIKQEKEQIRRLMTARRAALSQKEKDEAAAKLCRQLLRFTDQYQAARTRNKGSLDEAAGTKYTQGTSLSAAAQKVCAQEKAASADDTAVKTRNRGRLKIAVFSPFRDEIDLSVCFASLLALPADLYFPKMIKTRSASEIHFFKLPEGLLPSQWLRPGHFGVPEPPAPHNEGGSLLLGEQTPDIQAPDIQTPDIQAPDIIDTRNKTGLDDRNRAVADKRNREEPGARGVDTMAKTNCEVPAFDLMLVPGLAFDRAGYRLGWGKAYYDRYLSRYGPNSRGPCCIGIGYSFQLLNTRLPRQPHDVPLDFVITPDTIRDCGYQN